jgi:hypothetical protein
MVIISCSQQARITYLGTMKRSLPRRTTPTTFLSAGHIGRAVAPLNLSLVLCSIFLGSTSWAQDGATLESPPANQAVLSNDDIAQNEERLKKLEEELLKTLKVSNQEVSAEKPQGSSTSSVRITDIEAPSGSNRTQGQATPPLQPISNSSAHVNEEGGTNSGSLKDLENHPVLRGSLRKSSGTLKKITHEPDADLSHRLAIAESQVEILSRELDTTRKRLHSAEHDTSQLPRSKRSSTTLSSRHHPSSLASDFELAALNEDNEWTTTGPEAIQASYSGTSREVRLDDYESGTRGRLHASAVASIAVESAPLRVGPGQRESALFVMPRHAHVTIEHRTGEWYRVITDSGTRGWVASNALVFDAGVPPTSTVRVRGFKTRNELPNLR